MRGWVLVVLVSCSTNAPEGDSGMGDVMECVPFSAEAMFRIVGIPDLVDGEVEGADIDGIVTSGASVEGCGMPDHVDPIDGRVGIDNRLAELKPTFDELSDEPIDTLLRSRDIQLQVRVEPSDACVRVTVQIDETIVSGEGVIDAEGNVRANLDGRWQPTGLLVETENDHWDIGELSLRVDRDMTRAMLAGSQNVGPWIVVTDGEETPPEIRDSILDGIHDLHPNEDGLCQAMSLAFIAEPI